LKRASLLSETLPLIRNPPTPVNQSQSASEPTLSWTPPFHVFFPDENLLSRTQQPHPRVQQPHSFCARPLPFSISHRQLEFVFVCGCSHTTSQVDPLFWQPAIPTCSQTQTTCYSSQPSTIIHLRQSGHNYCYCIAGHGKFVCYFKESLPSY
jgi:hypothetical protein